MLQGVQSANGLKAQTSAKKTDRMPIAVTTKKNVIKQIFGKRLAITLDTDFSSTMYIFMNLKKI